MNEATTNPDRSSQATLVWFFLFNAVTVFVIYWPITVFMYCQYKFNMPGSDFVGRFYVLIGDTIGISNSIIFGITSMVVSFASSILVYRKLCPIRDTSSQDGTQSGVNTCSNWLFYQMIIFVLVVFVLAIVQHDVLTNHRDDASWFLNEHAGTSIDDDGKTFLNQFINMIDILVHFPIFIFGFIVWETGVFKHYTRT